MVIHYPPAQVRHNSDQPTAVTDVLVATSGSFSTGEIPLGTPTCSARTRRGRWALYPSGDQVLVVWPGGALAGPPVEVAGELDRLGGDGHDALDRGALWAIRQFLTDPAAADGARWSSTRTHGPGRPPRWATGSAAPPTSPATTPTHRPTGPAHQHRSRRSRCPTPAHSRHQHEPPDHNPTPSKAEPRTEPTT
jgi:hypothetical protein